MSHTSLARVAVQICHWKVIGASHGSNSQIRWWTLEVRRVTKLEECYQPWLAFGTPKVCARVLEKRVHLLVESPIHEEKLFLSSSWNTKPSFLPLKDI